MEQSKNVLISKGGSRTTDVLHVSKTLGEIVQNNPKPQTHPQLWKVFPSVCASEQLRFAQQSLDVRRLHFPKPLQLGKLLQESIVGLFGAREGG
jgi:hypothetical protein